VCGPIELCTSRQVMILERDPAIPGHSKAAESADGDEYLACARARIGSPQFLQLHVFLKRGWCAVAPPCIDVRSLACGNLC